MTRALFGLLLALVVVAAVAPIPAVGADGHAEERVAVDLQADGDATVTTTVTFDLTHDADRAAFRGLEANESTLAADYAARLRPVAAAVAEETGREMSVSGPAADLERHGDRGVVRLSAEWTGLAAVEDEILVLSAPFDDGFVTDRPLVVRVPDGYAVTSTAVEPATRSDGEVRWTAPDLDGFEVQAAPAAAAADTAATTDGSGAGAVDGDGSEAATEDRSEDDTTPDSGDGDGALGRLPTLALPGVGLAFVGGLAVLRRHRN